MARNRGLISNPRVSTKKILRRCPPTIKLSPKYVNITSQNRGVNIMALQKKNILVQRLQNKLYYAYDEAYYNNYYYDDQQDNSLCPDCGGYMSCQCYDKNDLCHGCGYTSCQCYDKNYQEYSYPPDEDSERREDDEDNRSEDDEDNRSRENEEYYSCFRNDDRYSYRSEEDDGPYNCLNCDDELPGYCASGCCSTECRVKHIKWLYQNEY